MNELEMVIEYYYETNYIFYHYLKDKINQTCEGLFSQYNSDGSVYYQDYNIKSNSDGEALRYEKK